MEFIRKGTHVDYMKGGEKNSQPSRRTDATVATIVDLDGGFDVPNCQISWLHTFATLYFVIEYMKKMTDGDVSDWINLGDVYTAIVGKGITTREMVMTIQTMMEYQLMNGTVSDNIADAEAFLTKNEWDLNLSPFADQTDTIFAVLKSSFGAPWSELRDGTHKYRYGDNERVFNQVMNPRHIRRDSFGNINALFRFHTQGRDKYGYTKVIPCSVRLTHIVSDPKEVPFDKLAVDHLNNDRGNEHWTTVKPDEYDTVEFPSFKVQLNSANMSQIAGASIKVNDFIRDITAVAADGFFELNHQRINYECKSIAIIQYRSGPGKPLPDDKMYRMYSTVGGRTKTLLGAELFVQGCPIGFWLVDETSLSVN